MTEPYLHDLKKIATIMKELIKAMDKLFIDVENKEKGASNGRMDNTELGTVCSGTLAAGTTFKGGI